MFAACSQKYPKHAPVYARMLAPPFSCDVNWSEVPRVDKGSKAYKERYAKMQALMASERARADFCGMVTLHCMEALPAVPQADKNRLLAALEDETGQAAAALPPIPTTRASTADARVPDNFDALLAHPNENTRLKGLLAIYANRTRLPENVIERIWRDSAKVVRNSVLRYPYLNERQIDSILRSGDMAAIHGLTHQDHWPRLTESHLSQLIALRRVTLDRRMAETAKLSPALVQQLARNDDPETALWLAYRYGSGSGNGSVAGHMEKLIATGDPSRIKHIVWAMKPIPSELVDLVLRHPDATVRSHLTTNGNFQPTAAQVDLILQDPDRDVQIGLLRKSEIPISREQLSKGINHADKNLAFWYRHRLGEAKP